MTEQLRLFVAVTLPDGLRGDVRAAMAAWRAHPTAGGLRWTDPGALHVTLAFLGSVDASRVPMIGARVADVASRHDSIGVATGGLGAFPRASAARVLWYGVDDADGRLGILAGDLREALGIAGGGPFRAHVTLARSRDRDVDVRPLIAHSDAPSARIEVAEVELIRSHLGRGAPRYEVIDRSPLGTPLRV
jgi:RNA 2',3'-cyclic 3'-phosphodiesterase